MFAFAVALPASACAVPVGVSATCQRSFAYGSVCVSSFLAAKHPSLRSASSLPRDGAVDKESTTRGKPPIMASLSSLANLPTLKTIDGADLPASVFHGKVTLAVNVASACGYTNSGYGTMKELAEMYPNDLVVVAIPCNQFGKQENGTSSEIAAFARGKSAKLVITERTDVNGSKVHPIMAIGKAKFPGDVRVRT
jgi:glutathione peroxidase-family protein